MQLRGAVIVAYVRFFQHVQQEEAVDEEALREYAAMGALPRVPEALVRSAVAPTDPEVANILRTTFMHDRTGAAGVRQRHEEVEAALRAATGSSPPAAGPINVGEAAMGNGEQAGE
jgi:hypothetical protein